jgi:hypothetical protein
MDSDVILVQNIAVANRAAFDLFFGISWIGPGGTKEWTHNNSGSFSVLQSRAFDLGAGDPPIRLGAQVWPTAKADGGGQMDGNTGTKTLLDARNGKTATFTDSGRPFGCTVNLDS